MGAEEHDFFEKYNPLPHVLDGKSGRTGFPSETVLYILAGIIALTALGAFAYFSFAPISTGNTASAVPEVANPNFVIGYYILSDNGTRLTNGTARLEDIKDLNKNTFLILSDRVYSIISKLNNGEEITINLSAAEASGERDLNLIKEVNRTEVVPRRAEVNRTVTVTTADFVKEFGSQPVLNKTYNVQDVPWNYSVSSINGDAIVVKQNAIVGQIVPISDIFFMSIAEVKEDTIITMLNAEQQNIQLPSGNLSLMVGPEFITLTLTPQIGQLITLGSTTPARVLRYDDKKIFLDYNSDYAGKNLVLKVKMIDRK